MEKVWINGRDYQVSNCADKHTIEGIPGFERSILSFITDWKSGKKEFKLRTSGSTGDPKDIFISRDQMIASAETTINFLGIKPNQNILLCLDPNYVAGLMQIVRALVGKCNLFAAIPTSSPLTFNFPEKGVHLCSFVPMQVSGILNDKEQKTMFSTIENVLIGGGNIDTDLEKALKSFPNNIYHTFGMTETLSHIALRKISDSRMSHVYKVLKGIDIKVDQSNRLQIKGAVTDHTWITTNDVVTLHGIDSFTWEGRIDHVINSGGKKMLAENIESKISEVLDKKGIKVDFIITGVPDLVLGAKIVLIISDEYFSHLSRIKELLIENLDKHEIPRDYLIADKDMFTNKAKLNRKSILSIAKPAISAPSS